MRRTPINQITLEGPDLSGKTSLYQKLHEKSGYCWNIQDRSSLSMIVYAPLYGRIDYFHVESLKREISNLNNTKLIKLSFLGKLHLGPRMVLYLSIGMV